MLKFLHIIFLWSVYIFNCWPNKIVLNSFKVSDLLGNFFMLLYTIVTIYWFTSVGLYWFISTPIWDLPAPISISKLLLKSGYFLFFYSLEIFVIAFAAMMCFYRCNFDWIYNISWLPVIGENHFIDMSCHVSSWFFKNFVWLRNF